MDLHYQKEITVGTLVLAGIGLFVAGTLWLKGSTIRSPARTEQVRFTDTGGLQIDNEVRVSGYPVGKVIAIAFERPGRVLVTITVPPSLELHSDASATIVTSIFASGSSLSLSAGSESAPLLAKGQVIVGAAGSDLFAKGSSLADRADSALIGVQAIANQRTADNLTATLASLQRVLNTLNQRLPATTDEAQRTMIALRHLSERLDSTITTLPVGNAIERADTLARNLSTMSLQLTTTGASLDTLLQKVNRGEGTIGKFMSDTGLYQDTRRALQSMQALIDELTRHPAR